jgi:quercetin dioxygenase-like cupin family protein
MVDTAEIKQTGIPSGKIPSVARVPAYDEWTAGLGIPIHEAYYIEDLRTLELGWWENRKCHASVLKLAGQAGVSEVRVTEIPPGGSTSQWKMALDEIVYVLDGRGLTSVWAEGKPTKVFEWQKYSMFLIPRNYVHQFVNMQGERPARLLHYNSLPIAMSINPDPDFYFNNAYTNPDILYGEDAGTFYSEAKLVTQESKLGDPGRDGAYWMGNFFPNMRAWDKLVAFRTRGAGGRVVQLRYPRSPLKNHMSVFPARTYKKGHRHGGGTLIVIPEGEGYSLMWPDAAEKMVIPWHEASAFVPLSRWWHQHFNVGGTPARYIAFRSPRGPEGNNERVEDIARDQIEYPDEDPMVHQKFEDELAQRGLTSLMPEEAYQNRDYQWADASRS